MVRMNTDQQLFDELPVRRLEYDDGVVLAADVGVSDDTTVDVVDDTVILVVGDEQYEQPVPDGSDARAVINNGVLTIELSDEEEH
jgi:HSP20 family molecular chaperone IbpA